MPEGIQLLIEAWRGLRADLTRKPRARWTVWHRERAENLTGIRPESNPYTEIGDLSEEIWGAESGVLDEDTPSEEAAKAKGRAKMIARIDAEIAKLEAHDRTLDHAMLELDRSEAPDRAIFDDSKAAQLARRYEAEASRRFFKLMDQLKKVEAEAAARATEAAIHSPPVTSVSAKFVSHAGRRAVGFVSRTRRRAGRRVRKSGHDGLPGGDRAAGRRRVLRRSRRRADPRPLLAGLIGKCRWISARDGMPMEASTETLRLGVESIQRPWTVTPSAAGSRVPGRDG